MDQETLRLLNQFEFVAPNATGGVIRSGRGVHMPTSQESTKRTMNRLDTAFNQLGIPKGSYKIHWRGDDAHCEVLGKNHVESLSKAGVRFTCLNP